MLIAARNAMMVGKRLPYDAEVEYLESTGTQTIVTGVKSSDIDAYSVRVMAVASTDFARILGASDGIKTLFTPYLDMKGTQYALNSSLNHEHADSPDINFRIPHTYRVERNQSTIRLYVDGVQKFADSADYTPTTAPINICSPSSGARFRIYGVDFYNGANLLGCFIPVRVGITGYMYDKVSGQLFGNAGTGSFIIGPDK